MAIVEGITGELREAMERAGFKMETAYMEVPRCETCRWWDHRTEHGLRGGSGVCGRFSRPGAANLAIVSGIGDLLTDGIFGCVQWEGKPDAG